MDTSVVRFLQQENARLQQENQAQQDQILVLHRYIDTLADLYWTSQHIEDEGDTLDVLDECVYDVMETIGAADGSVSYLDQETGELVFMMVRGELEDQLAGRRIKSDVGIVGWVLDNVEPVTVNNPRQDWRFFDEIDQEFGFMTRSILCVPVVYQDETIGAVELLNKAGSEFSQLDVSLVSVLSDIVAMVLVKLQTSAEETPVA